MIATTLLLLSISILGIFIGAQLTEAILFVPYWKSLHPNDFFELHKTYGKKIHAFFAPLTIAATLFPLTMVTYYFVNNSKELTILTFIGVTTLAFFSTYFLYFKKANQKFADRSIPDGELSKELIVWGNCHWARIFLECTAFVLSIILLLKSI